MRKIALFLAVLFMTMPVMAVPSNVDITCVVDQDTVTLLYDTDANLIRAFGLDITVSGANIVSVVPVDANYRIYPGQIVITAGEVTNYSNPYAAGDVGDANVTIEMASLYTTDPCYATDGNSGYNMIPGTSGTLLSFSVDGYCTYSVTENPARGGVVMEDPNEDPNVALCSGTAYVCIVPDVVDMNESDANDALVAAGLVVGNKTYAYDDAIADGNVISQNPTDGGTQVPCDSAVDLEISLGPCVVPDIVGMTMADANAAIVAAGFVVGDITTANSETIPYKHVISSDPPNPDTPGCGTDVNYVASDGSVCYLGQPDEAEWTKAGRPICWCYPRQCYGDADGLPYGKSNYYVASPDLTILQSNWSIPNGPTTYPGTCADFDHLPYGKSNYRVASPDLTILQTNWSIINGPIPGPPNPTPCAPGNRTP